MVVDLAPAATETVENAVAMAGTRGTVVRKELRMIGVRGHDHRSVVPAIETIRCGRYPVHLLTTHRFPLEKTHEALELAGRRTDPSAIHVSVLPGANGADR
jgi:threonine dehydrogenase-like Zn-dependent dehydrogenase